MQLAVSCKLWTVLCPLVCPETDWNICIAKHERLCVYLTLRSGVLMFRIPNINQCVKNFLRLGKAEFIKWITNFLFIGFVKQWLSAYQDQFCVWFYSLARQRTAGEFLLCHILRKETALSFFFLLDYASRTSSMPRQYFFLFLSFAQSFKILSKFSKISAILKRRSTEWPDIINIHTTLSTH